MPPERDESELLLGIGTSAAIDSAWADQDGLCMQSGTLDAVDGIGKVRVGEQRRTAVPRKPGPHQILAQPCRWNDYTAGLPHC